MTDPAHATRIATVPSDSGFTNALAFSPRGNLLADVSYDGTVTVYSLADPARPVRAATMQTVTARQIAASICAGGCGPMYTLNFTPDGQTLTAVADLSPPAQQALSANTPQLPQVARNYAFVWDVANPRSVSRTAVLSARRRHLRWQQPAAPRPQRAHHRDRSILRLRGDTVDAALTRASRCPLARRTTGPSADGTHQTAAYALVNHSAKRRQHTQRIGRDRLTDVGRSASRCVVSPRMKRRAHCHRYGSDPAALAK